MDKVLLSICIPTYNGGTTIEETLNCLIKAIDKYDDIEVIVSDNCSDDNTKNVLNGFQSHKQLRIYRNESNVGFNGNLVLLLDKYAQGKYCWVLGDDDFVTKDSIDLIYNLLSSGDADYIAVGFQTRYAQNYQKKTIKRKPLVVNHKSYFEIMDKMASLDNILGTFMSVHVFNLKMVRDNITDNIKGSDFNSFANIFPNSYLITNTFYNNERCYIVENKIIEAIFRKTKSYGNKWANFVTDIFPSYYNYCLSLSSNKKILKRNKAIIDDINLQVEINIFLHGDLKNVNYKKILSSNLFGGFFRYIKHQFEKRLR